MPVVFSGELAVRHRRLPFVGNSIWGRLPSHATPDGGWPNDRPGSYERRGWRDGVASFGRVSGYHQKDKHSSVKPVISRDNPSHMCEWLPWYHIRGPRYSPYTDCSPEVRIRTHERDIRYEYKPLIAFSALESCLYLVITYKLWS